MALSAGELRHVICLQRPQIEQDPTTGEMLTTWVEVATPYAQIVPSSVREFLAAGAEQSEGRGRIVIRYREDVDASMRVVHRGKVYAIHGVMADPVSGLEYLTLAVGEGVRLNP